MAEYKTDPVTIDLIYRDREFCVWAWVERRTRTNFQPLLQAVFLRKQELLAAKRSRMKREQKTEAGVGFVSTLPNISWQILQDSSKSASAREGALTFQVALYTDRDMWEQELHVAQGDQKPRQEYSAAVKMDLDCNTLNNPLDGKAKLTALPASLIPLLPFPRST